MAGPQTLVPEIRFRGFSDEWKEVKLAELEGEGKLRLCRGNVISTKDIIDNPGNYPIYSSSAHKNGEMGRYGSYMFEKELVTWSIDGGGAVFYRPKHRFSVTNVCGYVDIKSGIDNAFLAYQLGRIHKGISFDYTVKAHPSVIKSLYYLGITSEGEQKAIGILFKSIDLLISIHTKKYEQLQNVKKSMLEKMFPRDGRNIPEIRFAGFTNPWEQRKWSDTVDISTDMVDPKTGLYDDLPHVAPGNIESFTGRLYDNVKFVKDENLISGKFRFNAGDIIYGKINPQLGKYVFAAFSGLTSADAYVLNAKNGVDQKYLYAVLQTQDFFDYSVSVSKRSGMPKINRDELNAYSFLAPSQEEQQKIGQFLLSIDNLITLHQRKYVKLQQIKKSMLEKMFV